MDIQLLFIKFALFLLKMVLAPICHILSLGRKKICPPVKNPLLLHSAKKLAELIRSREVTSEQIIRAYITRALEVNPIINAIVEDRFELAIQEAIEIDTFIASGKKTVQELELETPLLGVPITVKESISVQGMSNAAGAKHLEKPIAINDADIVNYVKKAGAIPILVSNTPELCLFWETYNGVTGRTLNPYDTRRTVGGSSGGEAALMGSGASVLGLGSDIGGSLRIPAMFTGVFGHKPTPGAVSVEGHEPGCSASDWPKYFAVGPITRYAEDISLLLNVIAKPGVQKGLRLNEEVSIKNIEVFYMENNSSFWTSSVDNDIVQAMRKFVRHLEKEHGILAQKANIKEMKNSFSIAVPILLDIDHVTCPFYNETTQQFKLWPEFFKFITFRSNCIFPVICYGILKKFSTVFFSKNKIRKACEANANLQEQFKVPKSLGKNIFWREIQKVVHSCNDDYIWDVKMGDNGVFLYPTFPNSAHFHHGMWYKLLDVSYMAIFNTLGLPVTNCPTGLNSKGLPIGFQVVANPNNDRLTIAVAKEIEKFFGGWQSP